MPPKIARTQSSGWLTTATLSWWSVPTTVTILPVLRMSPRNTGFRLISSITPTRLRRQWVLSAATVGVAAGASVPEVLVEQVIERLQEWGGTLAPEDPGVREAVIFSLPRELAKTVAAI
jgi:hypothetical protein